MAGRHVDLLKVAALTSARISMSSSQRYLSGSLSVKGAMPQVLDTLVYNCLAYACLIAFAAKAYATTNEESNMLAGYV